MGWARLDDGMHDHPKLIGLSLEALGLWVKCLTWCIRNEQRSFSLPTDVVRSLGGRRRTERELERADLWFRTGDRWALTVDASMWTFSLEREKVPAALRRAVLERDGHQCVRCGTEEDLQMDHVQPWSLGGPTTFENLQTLCGPCNRAKGAKV